MDENELSLDCKKDDTDDSTKLEEMLELDEMLFQNDEISEEITDETLFA